jgi:hypothetical protein
MPLRVRLNDMLGRTARLTAERCAFECWLIADAHRLVHIGAGLRLNLTQVVRA